MTVTSVGETHHGFPPIRPSPLDWQVAGGNGQNTNARSFNESVRFVRRRRRNISKFTTNYIYRQTVNNETYYRPEDDFCFLLRRHLARGFYARITNISNADVRDIINNLPNGGRWDFKTEQYSQVNFLSAAIRTNGREFRLFLIMSLFFENYRQLSKLFKNT